MTQEQHPITPPLDLVQIWANDAIGPDYEQRIAIQAARWGADMELDACCSWVEVYAECGGSLRAARRPKPPSLKEKASQIVDCLIEGDCLNDDDAITLRQVVESLPS